MLASGHQNEHLTFVSPFCEVVYEKWYILSRYLPYSQDNKQSVAPKRKTKLDKEQIFDIPLSACAIPLVDGNRHEPFQIEWERLHLSGLPGMRYPEK